MWFKLFILLMGTVIYRQQWTSYAPEGIDCKIDITDMDTYVQGSEPEYRALTGISMKLDMPFTDDVHEPIWAQRLTFTFVNDQNTYLQTFSTGHDKRWYVKFWYRWFDPVFEVYDLHTVFEGYLNMDYNSEPYLPKGHPVTLTANDGLADLQNIDLVNFDDERPTGKHSLKDILCWILRKTGLERQINIMDNIFETHHDDRDVTNWKCPWAQTLIDLRTLEGTEINKVETCWVVLEKILRSRLCRLFYYDGQWWITRIDELKNTLQHWTQYNPGGTVGQGNKDVNLMRNIAAAPPTALVDTVTFINASSIVKIKRPRKEVKWLVDYEFPLEIVCNINFERGVLNAPSSTPDYTAYDVECWTVKRGLGSSATGATTTAIIKRFFVDGYEDKRYVTLFNPSSGSTAPLNYLESEAVEVTERDKFSFNMDYSWPGDASSGASLSEALFMIRLEGDDGTHWTVDDDGKWYQSDANWTTFLKTIDTNWVPDDVDERLWRSGSVNAQPAPVTGKLYIMLQTHNQNPAAIDNVDTNFDNISFDYKPFINGGYSNYVGEHHRVYSGAVNKNFIEERRLYLFDSTRKLFKGALFYDDAGTKKLTAKWNDWALQRNGVAGVNNSRIGKILAWNLWDMYRREMVQMECDFRGFNISSKTYFGPLHPVTISGSTLATLNKKFMIRPVEQNWYTMQWRAIAYEVHDFILDADRDFGASGALYEFKYLSR